MPNFVVDTLQLVDATVKPYTVTAWSNVAAANATSLRLMLTLYVALFGIFVWYGDGPWVNTSSKNVANAPQLEASTNTAVAVNKAP